MTHEPTEQAALPPAKEPQANGDTAASDADGKYGANSDYVPDAFGRYWRNRCFMWSGWFGAILHELRQRVGAAEFPEGSSPNALDEAMQLVSRIPTAAGVPELVAERDRLAGELNTLAARVVGENVRPLLIAAKEKLPADEWRAICSMFAEGERVMDGLRDRTTAAEAALQAEKDAAHYANGVADLAIKHRDAAESKLAECERDAARIDWLAERFKTCTVRMNGQHPYYPSMHKLRDLKGPTFRAAIDDAIAARGEG